MADKKINHSNNMKLFLNSYINRLFKWVAQEGEEFVEEEKKTYKMCKPSASNCYLFILFGIVNIIFQIMLNRIKYKFRNIIYVDDANQKYWCNEVSTSPFATYYVMMTMKSC